MADSGDKEKQRKSIVEAINRIHQSSPEKSSAQKTGEAEEAALRDKLANDKLKAEIEGLRQDIGERKKYASKAFNLVIWWVVGVFILLVLNGLLPDYHIFSLSDTVLVAVVSGTTASVIGIFLVVANYLFPKK